MAINYKLERPDFNEKFYWDKFNMKRAELFNGLENNPGNPAIKEQIQFINSILKAGNESDWPIIWKEWKGQNFHWPGVKEKMVLEKK